LRFWSYGIPVAVAMGVVLVGRAAAVYPICAAFSRSSTRVSFQHQNLMLWGGLRGALALALALSLPASLPHRHEVITVAFAVVAFSVLVQGLTMPVFLRMAGEIPHRTHREADHD
jgi:CPA1 family monovalent cation:H+ antiporter